MVAITASDNIQYSSDGSVISCWNVGNPDLWYKTHEITVTSAYTGSWRIAFDFMGDAYNDCDGVCLGSALIYKNGVSYGTIVVDWGSYAFTTYSQDFTGINIASGDKIQLYQRPDGGICCAAKNFRIKFAQPPGSAAFTSNPSVADIFIEGVDTGYNTPSTVPNVAAGTRNWTLKKAGYADVSGTCVVPTGGTVTVPLVTFLASAAFTSSPTTARIWIDSVDKGIDTPGTVTGITAGTRNYTLKKATYLDYNSSFTATAGTTTTVPLATLTPSATTSVIIID